MSRVRLLAVSSCLSLLVGCSERGVALVHVADERDAIEILDALATAGITDTLQERETEGRSSTWNVIVASADLQAARRCLVERGLPRVQHAGFATDGDGFMGGLSSVREHAEYNRALNEEIARKLEVLSWVVSAEVMVGLPFQSLAPRAGSETAQPSASVIVRVEGSLADEAAKIIEIERVVRGSVPGFAPGVQADGRVAVVFDVIGSVRHTPVTAETEEPSVPTVSTAVSVDTLRTEQVGVAERVVSVALGCVAIALAVYAWFATRARAKAVGAEA
jgi:type III secretory pathway lipoprotein EscJ